MELTDQAQKVLDKVNEGIDPFDIKEEELIDFVQKLSCSDGFEYGIFEGGYIKPENILVGEDLKKVQDALKVYEEFRALWNKISIEF